MIVRSLPGDMFQVTIEPEDTMADIAAYTRFTVRELCKIIEDMIHEGEGLKTRSANQTGGR